MRNPPLIDSLSETLMKMRLKTSAAGAFDLGGTWAIEIPKHEGFKLHVILRGECWISVEGHETKYRLRSGDCLLMTGGRPSVKASDLSHKKKIKIADLLKTSRNGIATLNGGGDCFSIGTHFDFDSHLSKLIFAGLPPVIHIPGDRDQAEVLRWGLERFREEFFGCDPGRSLVLNHLAPIMLLQVLRIYLASAKTEKNWLVALSSPKLSKVIAAMHSDYQRSWTIEDLAELAGMSRSGFALHFKKLVGVAPMDYLTNWRMQIACDLLKAGERSLAEVASAVGYGSESAFSVAFKKIVKCRPGFYQRTAGT